MYVQEKNRNPRSLSMMLDLAHIVIGILIVVLAVFSFLNPEDHLMLFPVIFLLASVLNTANGLYKIHMRGHEKKRTLSGAAAILFGVALFILAVVSGVSIWWG